MRRTRVKQETQQREIECWRLRVAGLTQWQVADRLDISQAAVSKILRRLGERFAVEFTEEVRAQKAQQTAFLEQMASDAYAAWERSLDDAVTEVTTKGATKGGGDGDQDGKAQQRAQIVRTVAGQSGNPALLNQARGALADIRELWGMNAPLRQEHSGPGGGPIPIVREVEVVLPSVAPEPAESRGDEQRDQPGEELVLPLPLGNGAGEEQRLPRYPGGLEVVVDLGDGRGGDR